MDENDVINKNIAGLKELYPNQITETQNKELRKNFQETEKCWYDNVKRYSKSKEIKYLLICEAPLPSGDYFYCSTKNSLFTKVWNTFFLNKVCPNPTDAYQCLADIGFLLIDSLPYSVEYKSSDRIKPAYHALIRACLPWWLDKLNNNFTFSPDLKIAFGFKLNALSIIKATGGTICLNGKNFSIHKGQIAADIRNRWQPSKVKLENIFGTTSAKQTCKLCP